MQWKGSLVFNVTLTHFVAFLLVVKSRLPLSQKKKKKTAKIFPRVGRDPEMTSML